VNQADRDEGKSAEGLSSNEREEIRELRRKLRQMKQERGILANRCPYRRPNPKMEKGDLPPKSSDS
jgi:transposase